MKLIPIAGIYIYGLFLAKAFVVSPRQDSGPSHYLSIPFKKVHQKPPVSPSLAKRSSLIKRDNGYDSAILEDEDGFYSVVLNIGSPPQEVAVMLDTGSSDLYVVEASNPYCDADAATSITSGKRSKSSSSTNSMATLDCAQYGTFDPTNSSSFQKNDTSFSIVYTDYDFASGYWGADTVSMGNLTVKDVNFAVSNKSNASFGTFGIGLPMDETTNTGLNGPYTYENFPMSLKRQGFIKKSAYSLYLGNINDTEQGNILFGAVDHGKYSGQLYTLPLVAPYKTKQTPYEFYVTVQGIAIGVNNRTDTLSTTQFPALLDSGTTDMYVPSDYLEIIGKKLNYTYNSSAGAYTGDCPTSNDTSLIFDFGGFTIMNSIFNYIDQSDPTACYLRIYDSGDDTAIFGDSFLIDTYAVYDLDDLEISLAQVAEDQSSQNIDVILSNIPSAINAPDYSNTWSTSLAVSTGGNIYTLDSTTAGGSSKKNSGDLITPSSLYFVLSTVIYSLLV